MEESCFKTIPFTSLYIPLHIFVLYFGLVSRTLKECVMCFMFLASFGTRKDMNMGNSISNWSWLWQVLRCLHACWFYTLHPSQDDLEHTFTYSSQSLVLMVSAFRVQLGEEPSKFPSCIKRVRQTVRFSEVVNDCKLASGCQDMNLMSTCQAEFCAAPWKVNMNLIWDIVLKPILSPSGL